MRRVGSMACAALVVALTFGVAGCGGSDSDAEPPSMTDANGAGAVVVPPPLVEDVTVMPARPLPGQIVRAKARVSSADPDETRFIWRTGTGRPLGGGERLDTTGLDEGTIVELIVVASDGDRESAEHLTEIHLGESSVEIAFVAIDANAGSKPGAVLEAVVESTNDDRDDYEILYEWRAGGRVVGTHDELDTTVLSPGDVVVLTARLDFADHTTRAVSSQPITLSRGEAPKIVSAPKGGLEGGVFRYQMRATSAEPGAEISYSVSDGPDGLDVDAKSGLVTWRPTKDQRGKFRIELVASDQWGTGITQNFELRLDDPAPPASAR